MRRLPIILCTALLAAACTPQGGFLDKSQSNDALQAAKRLEKNGDLQGAAAAYRAIIQQSNAPVEAYIGLASIDRKTGQSDEAVALMKQAQSHEEGNPEVISKLGYALISAGQYEQAVNVFDQLIAMQPDNAMAYNGKAVAFDKAGNHVAAQEIYNKALSLAPDSLTIHNNLAMSLILNDKVNEAIIMLEILNRQPNANATVRQNLALAYAIKGDKKHALEITSRDLTPEQAQENLLFYEHYARMKKLEHAPKHTAMPDSEKTKTLEVLQPNESKPTN